MNKQEKLHSLQNILNLVFTGTSENFELAYTLLESLNLKKDFLSFSSWELENLDDFISQLNFNYSYPPGTYRIKESGEKVSVHKETDKEIRELEIKKDILHVFVLKLNMI